MIILVEETTLPVLSLTAVIAVYSSLHNPTATCAKAPSMAPLGGNSDWMLFIGLHFYPFN